MSSNLLINPTPDNKEIKEQRNCLNPATGKFRLRDFTKAHDDSCYLTEQTKQSLGPGKYQVSNHYSCECNIPSVVEIASNVPQLYFKNGYGVAGCEIDKSSVLRYGKSKNNPKCPVQLFERPYLTVPYMGRGIGDPNLEPQLLPGEPTKEKRQCSTLSGVTIDNYFTPLIDHLRENVQNPIHIVPEYVQDGWIRGGSNTRLIVRDIDYLERCGYQYMNKSSNDSFWESKHKHF